MVSYEYSVRGIVLFTLVTIGLGVWLIYRSSKEKHQYDKSTGIVEYVDKTYEDLPSRDKGKFRYIIIDTYDYLFEIYAPNSKDTPRTIDDLKIGDQIDIYYFENSSTHKTGINKFVQFIDVNNQPYFIRNEFQSKLGLALIILSILPSLIAYFGWKKGKVPW